MSLVTLKKGDLLEVAKEFGVEVTPDATKTEILSGLSADGVTWEMYKEAFPDEEVLEDAPAGVPTKPKGPTALLRMQRENGTYQVRGYEFTREHPFVAVSEEDANWILENVVGFSIASPRQAQEFYS